MRWDAMPLAGTISENEVYSYPVIWDCKKSLCLNVLLQADVTIWVNNLLVVLKIFLSYLISASSEEQIYDM